MTELDVAEAEPGSIDPLGFGPGYVALADALLPGITTISVRPRYLSVLCAAVRLWGKLGEKFVPGRRCRQRDRQREFVLRFERLWAAGALAAADAEGLKPQQMTGLMGVRGVRRALADGQIDPDYSLLRDQWGTGVVGAYKVLAAQELGLIHDREDELALLPKGEQLADAFLSGGARPVGSVRRALLRGDEIDSKRLAAWGSQCLLPRLQPAEADLLWRLLTAEGRRHRERERFLGAYAEWLRASEVDNPRDLAAFDVQTQALGWMRDRFAAKGHLAQAAAVDAVLVYESAYWRLLNVFDILRWFYRERRGPYDVAETDAAPVASAVAEAMAGFPENARRASVLEKLLSVARELEGRAGGIERSVPPMFRFFGQAEQAAASPADLCTLILDRHRRVQVEHKGKICWLDNAGGKVRLTRSRYGWDAAMAEPPLYDEAWGHNYRMMCAYFFWHDCGRRV